MRDCAFIVRSFLFPLIALAGFAPMLRAADPPQGELSPWKSAVGNFPQSDLGGNGKFWKVVAWPGKDMVIASMTGQGLWATADGGQTWKRLGAEGKAPPNAGQAVQFVFDPKDKNTFWTSGMYKYGMWKTTDGGATFTEIARESHFDGMAVDFSDPQRQTLLVGPHERTNGLQMSTDGGNTWKLIGDRFPKGSNFTTLPIIIDSKTFIVNTSGWLRKEDKKTMAETGMWRSEDAGATWTKTSSDIGAADVATVTSKGDIYYPVLWDMSLMRSTDQGKTWEKVKNCPAKGTLVEMPDGRLVGLGGAKGTQLYVSKDGGKVWQLLGKPAPIEKPRGLAYNDVRKAFFVYGEASPKSSDMAIVRWDVPADALEPLNEPAK